MTGGLNKQTAEYINKTDNINHLDFKFNNLLEINSINICISIKCEPETTNKCIRPVAA